jgi:glucose-1-phosphate adenylyltransferase
VLPHLDIYDRSWPLWSYAEVTPPAKFVHDDANRRGAAVSSLISGGCIISGSSLNRALIFTGVHAHSYSSVTDSVVLPYCSIGRGAQLHKVVIDANVKIPEGLIVGEDPEIDARRFRRSEKGICLITQAMIDRLGDGV